MSPTKLCIRQMLFFYSLLFRAMESKCNSSKKVKNTFSSNVSFQTSLWSVKKSVQQVSEGSHAMKEKLGQRCKVKLNFVRFNDKINYSMEKWMSRRTAFEIRHSQYCYWGCSVRLHIYILIDETIITLHLTKHLKLCKFVNIIFLLFSVIEQLSITPIQAVQLNS